MLSSQHFEIAQALQAAGLSNQILVWASLAQQHGPAPAAVAGSRSRQQQPSEPGGGEPAALPARLHSSCVALVAGAGTPPGGSRPKELGRPWLKALSYEQRF